MSVLGLAELALRVPNGVSTRASSMLDEARLLELPAGKADLGRVRSGVSEPDQITATALEQLRTGR